MKNMNILFSVFLCLYTFSLLGQNALDNSLILRSTFSTSTLTSGENRKLIHQQSSGQSGPSGTYASGGYLLSQGFVQSNVWELMTGLSDVLDLKVQIFPNPFVSEVQVKLTEATNSDVELILFSPLGKEMERYKFKEKEKIQISLAHLPTANYFIKIATNTKQVIHPIIKIK